MEISRRCDICIIDVHRASYEKHIRNKKLPGNDDPNELIITEWLFQEPVEAKLKKDIIPDLYKN